MIKSLPLYDGEYPSLLLRHLRWMKGKIFTKTLVGFSSKLFIYLSS
jgi:hypothetical protein